MALFNPIKKKEQDINLHSISDGQFLISTDTKKIFVDIDNLSRIEFDLNTKVDKEINKVLISNENVQKVDGKNISYISEVISSNEIQEFLTISDDSLKLGSKSSSEYSLVENTYTKQETDTRLNSKVEAGNIKAGTNITVTKSGNDVTINSTGTGIDGVATETDPTVPSWAKTATKPTYTAAEVGAVPTTRTVNGKALSVNISLTAADVGAVATETDPTVSAWAKAIVKPTYTAAEVSAVPTTRTVNGKALSANITLTAADIGAIPITGGTITGNLISNNPEIANSAVRNISATTTDLTAGVSALATGAVVFVYE